MTIRPAARRRFALEPDVIAITGDLVDGSEGDDRPAEAGALALAPLSRGSCLTGALSAP
jgi:predicted MPP superfamily phosphohydrolase